MVNAGFIRYVAIILAEPASNIETIENNVKHTAPKPTRTREGIKYPMSVCAISARNDARKRQNRQVKTGIIGILLANEQVRLHTSASSQTLRICCNRSFRGK